MQLSQIQLTFAQNQDRVLFRLASRDQAEVRIWLTRRLIQRLWPALIEVTTQAVGAAKPGALSEARDMLVAMQRTEQLQSANFSAPFQEKPAAFPLGETPFLAVAYSLTVLGKGQVQLRLLPGKGRGVDLNMGDALLHAFTKLLRDACVKADWGLNLPLPGEAMDTTSEPAQARLLN